MSDESSTHLGAQGASKPDFFSEHPEFFETSQTGAHPDRLRARHRAIIEHNIAIIAKRSILDIASHDGRWSLAALEAGASYVHGVEARAELVQKSLRMMEQYGIPREKYSFTVADVHDHLRSIEPGSVDTIFCLGFFYHTLHHHFLVQQFDRIGAQHVIVDTVIWPSTASGSFKNGFLREWIQTTPNECIIRLGQENPAIEQNAVNPGGAPALVGYPTIEAIELLFNNQGFSCTYFNWHDGFTKDWTELTDYGLKERVTFVASRKADTR